jgi:simple sugar transport system permease protein
VLASLAGLISVTHTSSAKWDYGNSYLLIAILIAVMGGVNPAGGYGRIICVFFAATVLQFLSSLFNLLGVSQFFGDCAWGFLLLLSLAFAGGERVRAIFGFAQPNQRR